MNALAAQQRALLRSLWLPRWETAALLVGPHLARAFPQEVGEAVALSHPRDHGAHHGSGFHLFGDGRLGLDHDLVAGEMQGDIEKRAAFHQRHAEQSLHRVEPAQQGDAVADGVHGVFPE